jgi:hypothetical protein
LNEKPEASLTDIVSSFIDYCVEQLGIEQPPQVKFKKDPQWSARNKTFGRYNADHNLLEVSLAGRHVMDILRTVAHELTHTRQHEIEQVPDTAGATGSRWENQANAQAGVLMRDYAHQHPEFFNDDALEESSGYIPTKKQAGDPRFSMALTQDVQPGAVGKEANKLNLHTDSQGKPALLMKTANLREDRMPSQYQDLEKPRGPESKPTMPAGTVRVDVSDTYDWYKLGQHISNLKGLGKHDFGKGPPSTIISFGSEEEEHKYIKDLEKTGLTTTDIDPLDPNRPVGMPRQKTDPTYNVSEDAKVHSDIVNRLSRELKLFEEQDLFEINMSPTNLKKLAAQTGAMAGMEFEMIVPGADSGDDGDLEPDYDADENVMSIEDAVQFFNDGDYNGRRELQRLRESMSDNYQNWLGEAWQYHWESYKDTIVFRYGKENWSEADIAEIMGLDAAEAEALETRSATPEDYMDAAEKVIEDGLDPWLNDAQEDAQEDYYNDDHEER